jgi:Zn-dependent protease with chaperone function
MSLLRRIPVLAFALFLFLPWALTGCARETTAEHIANVYAAQEMAGAPLHGNLPDYSLPPEKLVKAQHLAKVETTLHFLGVLWGIAQIALVLWLGIAAWIRDRAVGTGAGLRARGKRFPAFWRECFVFVLLTELVFALANLPLGIYGHRLSLAYGLSVQSWGSWFGDWAKNFAVNFGAYVLVTALLVFIIRCLPRTWWVVFWAALAPIMIFAIYIAPLVIDPIFNKFEPLQTTEPALVSRLQEVVARGHMDIPPERMFLMRASAKTTQLNAYVTGFGNSKRLVLWDTTLAKMTPDEVLLVFGHESGHYVLGHITRGITLIFLGLGVLLWLAFWFVRWSLRRFGVRWGIPGQSDWGVLVVLFLAFSLFGAVTEPVIEGLTRQQEHAADVYGQEAVHGIVADPQQAAKGAFDVLGVNSLVDPNPSPLIEFWTFSHPAIGRRAAFGKDYDPWAAGMEPKYFRK